MADGSPQLSTVDKGDGDHPSLERRRKLGALCGLSGLALALVVWPSMDWSISWNLIVWLAMWLAIFHWLAAQGNWTVRQTKMIDYWYVGIGAVGAVLLTAGLELSAFSASPRAAIAEVFDNEYSKNLNKNLTNYVSRACSDVSIARFRDHCEMAKALERTAAVLSASQLLAKQKELDDLADSLEEPRDSEQSSIYGAAKLVSNSISLVASVRKHHEPLEASAVSEKNTPNSDWLKLLKLLAWPYVLAVALALRLTKVTIDAFEWTKPAADESFLFWAGG
jgi:hypothetical protein